MLPFCKLQIDSTKNTMKASEGSPRESLCWQAWSHHGGSQEQCPEHHAQLPHTATRLMEFFLASLSQHSLQLISWSSKDQESSSTWCKYSRKSAQKEEHVHCRLIQETNFKGSLFQRGDMTAPSPLSCSTGSFTFSSSAPQISVKDHRSQCLLRQKSWRQQMLSAVCLARMAIQAVQSYQRY